MADELLKLKWNGHLSSFLHIFQSLRLKARYTDVTLACEGQLFTVHRLVLASCSQFFDHIFEQTPAENTVVILNEAKARDVEALLDYMYCGQVDVQQSNLASFIRTAKCLQIKGLATPDTSDEHEKSKRSCSTDNEPAYKKKKSDSIPPLHPNVLSPISKSSINRHMDESPPKAISPSSVSALQNRWIFQKSDLPNTTWSTSHQQVESEGRENESFRANTIYGEEVWLADEPTSNTSPHPRKEIRLQQSHHGCQETEGESPLYKPSNHFYKESADYRQSDVINLKAEVKEEQKEYNPDDSENYASSEYSQNYSYMNTYDRENSPECYSNSVPFRRNVYENQSGMEAHHNQYSQSRLSHPLSMVKEIPATTSQATVSPKLMPYAKCSNCLTNNTKLWRRSMKGEIVCNACGLYYKLHGVNRPSHLFRNAPMTRRRNPRKKKKLYEEIAESRDHNSLEDKSGNDSYCNESGCEDPENQDGLAVLNAALTLNSLFAKAKAQEAAAAAAAAAAAGKSRSDLCQAPPAQLNLSGPVEKEGSGSQQGSTYSQMDGEAPPSSDSRPPPPPLLKLHPSSSPSHIHHYSSFPPSPRGFSCDSRREREEADSQSEEDPLAA